MSDSTFDDAANADEDYYSEEAATFGDRVAAAREMLGFNQHEFAERLGVLQETLADWEDDRAEPRANRLQMLAAMLNVSMGWLLNGEGDGLDTDEAGLDMQTRDVLIELRQIRAESTHLTARIGRLEKRLRAISK